MTKKHVTTSFNRGGFLFFTGGIDERSIELCMVLINFIMTMPSINNCQLNSPFNIRRRSQHLFMNGATQQKSIDEKMTI